MGLQKYIPHDQRAKTNGLTSPDMAMLTSGAAPSSPFFTGSLGDFGLTKAVAGSSMMLLLVNCSLEAKKSSSSFSWLSSGVSFEPSKCNCKRIYDPRTEWDSMIFAKGLTSFPNNYCNDSRKHRCQMNSTHRKTSQSHSFTHCRKSKLRSWTHIKICCTHV